MNFRFVRRVLWRANGVQIWTVNGSLLLRLHSKDLDREFKEGGSIVLTILFQSLSSFVGEFYYCISRNSQDLAKCFMSWRRILYLIAFVFIFKVYTNSKDSSRTFLKTQEIFNSRLSLRFQFKLCFYRCHWNLDAFNSPAFKELIGFRLRLRFSLNWVGHGPPTLKGNWLS